MSQVAHSDLALSDAFVSSGRGAVFCSRITTIFVA